MTTADNIVARLAQMPAETLAKELVRLANEADALSRTQRLHFQYEPDEAIKALSQNLPFLVPRDDLSYVHETSGQTHRLIIGDNAHSLMALQLEEETYDLAYSDPPYNTGREDFVYNDRFVPSDDAWSHSKWLSFMEPRLRLERRLLKRTGIKILAIGNRELAHVKVLMDSIYGEDNFIDLIVWEGGPKNDSRFVSNGCDYMLVYARNKSALLEQDVRWREEKPGVHDVLAAGQQAWEESGHDAAAATALLRKWWRSIPAHHPAKTKAGLAAYNQIHSNGKMFQGTDLSFPGGNGYQYDLIHPVTGKAVKIPSRGWVAPEARMKEWLAEDRIAFAGDESTTPRYRRYLDDMTTAVPTSVFFADRAYANRYIKDILGRKSFDFPKDHNVLARWFSIVAGKDAKILDCFAGSGSTLEAALTLNSQDGGTRTVTLLTNNENDIGVNVTRERAVRVMSGQGWADGKEHEGLGGHLAVYDVDLHDTKVGVKFFLDPRLSEVKRTKWIEKAHPLMGSVYGCNWLVEDSEGIAVYADDPVAPERHAVVAYDIFEATQDNFHRLIHEYADAVSISVQSCQSQQNLYLGDADVQMPAPQVGVMKRHLSDLYTTHYGDFTGKVSALASAVPVDADTTTTQETD